MMHSFLIRSCKSEDLPQVLTMIQALAAHHGDTAVATLEDLGRDMTGPHPWLTVLVVEDGGQLVGYAALCPLMQLQFGARGMDMHHLFVAKSHRKKGIGQALIAASIAQARAMHCRFLTVGTHPENTVAQGIYERLGFDQLPNPGPRFRMRL